MSQVISLEKSAIETQDSSQPDESRSRVPSLWSSLIGEPRITNVFKELFCCQNSDWMKEKIN